MRRMVWLAALAAWAATPAARAGFDVQVELENLSGEDKTDWPVVLRVCHVFGRNLPRGSIRPKGFHVYAPTGRELTHDVEAIPPYDWPGNDELVFRVPSIRAGETITVRVVNDEKPSARRAKIDLAHDPHNLIRNGGFEAGADGGVAGWSGDATRDTKVRRSGRASMLIEGTRRRTAGYTGTIKLHPGSHYYAGVWCKTQNVARYGTAAGAGGHFRVTGFEKVWDRAPTLRSQCYTRDWNKSRFFARYGLEYTDWGVDRGTVRAAAGEATLALGLDQKLQWCMTDPHGRWWLDDLVLIEQPKVSVRFDRQLAPLLRDGVFLFTRPTNTLLGGEASQKFPRPWAARPFAHEAVGAIDRWGLKGQRVPFLVGLYHTRPLEKVSCTVAGGAVVGEGGRIPVEFLEVSHGYVNAPHHYLMDHAGPVDFAGPHGVRYFLVTFGIPRDARTGRYAGRITLASDGKALGEVPIALRVQDMAQPVLKDRYIGMIMQASPIRYNPDTLSVYARSGFSCVTVFGAFLRYSRQPDADGRRHVLPDSLRENMELAKKHGLSGVCLYSDLQLDRKPRGPGAMHRCALSVPAVAQAHSRARAAREASRAAAGEAKKSPKDQAKAEAAAKTKAAYESAERAAYDLEKGEYFRLLREVDDECRKHPDWPVLIHMNWDEPGGPDPRMGWTNECLPHALTTLDAGFGALPRIVRYYTMPALDDPCDFNGPELYAWMRKQGKRFGLAASHRQGEPARYQPGIWVATSGASYMHAWHLAGAGLMKVLDGKAVRSVSMAAAGEGLDDLKMFTLLSGEVRRGLAGSDAKVRAAAEGAKAYLAEVFATFDGDGAHASGNPPHLGWVCTWGYERFYDHWQEQMARRAAAIRGVRWID